jgi:glycosyltransferase involved in cell wall biosynthesis
MIRRYLDERIYSRVSNYVPWPFLRPVAAKCLFVSEYAALALALCKSQHKVPLNSLATARANLEKIEPKRAMPFTTDKPFQASTCDLSVIVPAYNAEAFIERCLDSLLAQELDTSHEIIVVDDGSTDGTARILQKYAVMPSIKIISQQNRGLSGARNAGLGAARGQYIFFLDADDFVEPGSLAILLNKAFAADADIVDGSWRYIAGKRISPQIYPDRVLKLSDIYPLWHNGYAWGKLMKRALWKKARFPEGAIFEDSILPYLIHAQCETYASVSTIVLNYCGDNPHSITRTMRGNPKTLTVMWMFDNLFDFLARDEEFPFNEQLTDWAIVHYSAMMLITMGHFGDEVLRDVFVVAREILERHGLLRQKLGRKYLNSIVHAFCENDFAAWKTLARYY